VHRRDSFKAERILQERLFKSPKIEVVWDSAIEEVCGDQNPPGVTHAKLRNVKTGAITERKVDGVFVAIGHEPASHLFAGQLEIKPNGYIHTAPDSTATNIPGVYAAGDVTDDIYRQAVTAAGMGCMAALEAERWLTVQGTLANAAE
jgi:thioredoxin reductase (NADPH)